LRLPPPSPSFRATAAAATAVIVVVVVVVVVVVGGGGGGSGGGGPFLSAVKDSLVQCRLNKGQARRWEISRADRDGEENSFYRRANLRFVFTRLMVHACWQVSFSPRFPRYDSCFD